ncbi:hypothetical protein A2362_04240 [Candidatus Curtissbacteria bacterium RIFOXYB1_FULL_41_59]|uniref:Glycosyltransferase 2-like domain-containing protein n=1 Tax=Candidatus Curtissbacteria bacterium RIFOXYA1_FULL_41_14 TaxID=1797737 RepID=A0A1F5HG29_9BACT|nr:MAG: hypothetical protein UU53_C0012G0015 [Candidatus Curtissbacteria bacterium GW2011_GWC2_41_21]OGE03107.1 MAG: hypothetical protein A2196_03985 [Candidatus Curtissbacteria bacterium RIFOXYA1_FULL_41_14]OGE06287.1 MAG: hypothetical protein A2362_04240 [Candidatus Curtissbacteria bacterium RIFOXYB1_FULL_41_59]OGE09016.1 MAG: hypothetical protein A2615_00025 [Candidatus Curtissbacteria bacterium RIFOXYD1_FULL_41_36]OGE12207.1 MAG: hypothetical protein A2305_00255 [Candidatus Curtissbacteria 
MSEDKKSLKVSISREAKKQIPKVSISKNQRPKVSISKKQRPKVSISKNQRPKVSIIFTNYNGGQNPLSCLSSIEKLNYPKSQLETIVVDNHSTDGSTKLIKKKFPKVKVLYQKKNLGFAKGINVGIRKAKGDHLFITNDDVTFEKNSLKTLIDFAQKQNDCIIGGKQVHPQTKKFVAGGRKFSLLTGMQTGINARSSVVCDQVDGCAMLIPRKLIKVLSLFDEGFYPVYGEDLDFCLRAKKAKIHVIYHPKAIFYHNPSQSVSKLPLADVYFYGFKNRLRLMLKHANPLQLAFFLIFHYLLIMPFRIITRKEPILKAEIKALIWNIKNLKKTLREKRGN